MKLPLNFPVLCDPAALGSCGRKYQFIITKGYTLCLAVWSYLEKATRPSENMRTNILCLGNAAGIYQIILYDSSVLSH